MFFTLSHRGYRLLYCVSSLAALCILSRYPPVVVNHSPSIACGYYVIHPIQQVDRGTVVRVYEPSFGGYLLKVVAGLPGEGVTRVPGGVGVGGQYLAITPGVGSVYSQQDSRPPGGAGAGTGTGTGAGYFIAGDTLDSYDSRYFGRVARSRVVVYFLFLGVQCGISD